MVLYTPNAIASITPACTGKYLFSKWGCEPVENFLAVWANLLVASLANIVSVSWGLVSALVQQTNVN